MATRRANAGWRASSRSPVWKRQAPSAALARLEALRLKSQTDEAKDYQYTQHVRHWLLLAALTACTDAERIEVRACNETGANMTRFSWASADDKPLRVSECTDYRESDANVCDETNVAFDIEGETYRTQRTDCYASDYGVTYGRWTVHVTIGSTEFHTADITVTRD